MARAITGLDIIRGKTINNSKNTFDLQPWHMIPESEKTQEWIENVADFHEMHGWQQVLSKQRKILKNRRLVAGELDLEDYQVGSSENDLGDMIHLITPQDITDPLKQFFPIIPNVIQTLLGEGMQKDNRVIVKAVDPYSTDERLRFKDEQFRQILTKKAQTDKQIALIQQGFIPDENNEQLAQYYQEQMQLAAQAAEVENKYKTFRTQAEIFGEHVLAINREKFKMDMLETEGFGEMLTNSEIAFHFDMGETDFKFHIVDNALAFKHVNKKFRKYSDGDYFGWFDFMTVGDIINEFGKRGDFGKDQLDKLKEIAFPFTGTPNVGMPEYLRHTPGANYDTSKPYPKGYINVDYARALEDESVKAAFGLPNKITGNKPSSNILKEYMNVDAGDPRMFRVMRLYFRSQRIIGNLIVRDRSGQITYQGWVDENWEQTVEPEYDKSIYKGEAAKNHIYGEHVTWTYCNEWREVIKISSNMSHWRWKTNDDFTPIYLGGKRCKFQFKGEDPFDIRPPFEGMEFRTLGTRPISLADRMRPWQISANICGNKMNQAMAFDLGKALVINKQTVPRDISDGDDYIGDYIQNIRQNKIIEISTTKEQLQGGANGAPLTPTLVNMSSADEAQMYGQLYSMVRDMAFESVGVTRGRTGGAKAYESMIGVQQNVQFSETQTLKYFNDYYVDFLPIVYQRMLEATQYYCANSDVAALDYMTSDEMNAYLEVASDSLLHRVLHVYATATPRVKQLENKLKEALLADNTMGLTMIDKAAGLMSPSVTKMFENLKTLNDQRVQREQDNFDKAEETKRMQIESMERMAQDQRDRDDRNKQLDRESKERIAVIGAMDAEGSDVANQLPNAVDVVNANLAQQELNSKIQNEREKVNLDRQRHIDDILLAQQEQQTKLKMKQIDERIAKENKNRFN